MEHQKPPEPDGKKTIQTSKTPVIVGIVSLFVLLVVVLIGFMFPTQDTGVPKPNDTSVYDSVTNLPNNQVLTPDPCPLNYVADLENNNCKQYSIGPVKWELTDANGGPTSSGITSVNTSVIDINGNDLYIYNSPSKKITKVVFNQGGTELYDAQNDSVSNLYADNNYIYFIDYSGNLKLNRISKSTGNMNTIFTDSQNSWTYYNNFTYGNNVYYYTLGFDILGTTVQKPYIYKYDSNGNRSTITIGNAGTVSPGSDSGWYAYSTAVDENNNVYVTFTRFYVDNSVPGGYATDMQIKKVTPGGNVSNFGPEFTLPLGAPRPRISWAGEGKVLVHHCGVICNSIMSLITEDGQRFYDLQETTENDPQPVGYIKMPPGLDNLHYMFGTRTSPYSNVGGDAGVFYMTAGGNFKRLQNVVLGNNYSSTEVKIGTDGVVYIQESVDSDIRIREFSFTGNTTSLPNGETLEPDPLPEDNNNTSSSSTTSSSTSTAQAANPTEALFRFYRPSTLGHLYTNRIAERNKMRNREPFRTLYNYENEKNQVFPKVLEFADPNAKKVYRAFNIQSKTHRYTINTSLYNSMNNNTAQWLGESYKFHAYATQIGDSVPFHEFYNSITGGYFYTSREGERRNVERNLPQFQYQGISFYVFPKSGS